MKPNTSIFCFLLLASNLVMGVQAQDFLTNGLVAYYPFSGNANDASGNGNNLTVNGASLATDRFGTPINCYSFFTNTLIGTVTNCPLGNSPRTLSLWMRTTNGDYSFTGGNIATWGTDANLQRFGFCIHGGVPVFIGYNVDVTGTNFLADNVWHQIVITYATNSNSASNTATVFVDGRFDNSGTMNLNTVDPELVVGDATVYARSHGGHAYYDGLADDIRIYNRPLSALEVLQLYQYESGSTCPRAATAIATVVNGFMVGAPLTDTGCGYTNVPAVYIVGGGGSGAQATAVVSNGVVTSVTVISPGSGYTNTPTVVIVPPVPLMLGIGQATRLIFTNLSITTNYQMQVSQSNTWFNLGSSFVASSNNYTQYFDGTVDGSLYRLVKTSGPHGATATAILSYGFVVSATVNDGGSGYVSVPAVQIIGGGGSGAQGTATVSNGMVTAITMTNAGFGYTNLPAIQIELPPIPGLFPDASPAFRLDYLGLAVGAPHQLQASPQLITWTNSGPAFTPTSITNSQYFGLGTNKLFFRLLRP